MSLGFLKSPSFVILTPMAYLDILLTSGAIIIGCSIGLFVIRPRRFDEKEIRAKAERAENEAEKEGEELVVHAREKVHEEKKTFEIEQQEFTQQLNKMEQLFSMKTNSFQKRETRIREFERLLQEEEKTVRDIKFKTEEDKKLMEERLIHKTGMAGPEVRGALIKKYEQDYLSDAELRIQRYVEWMQECAVRDGRNILSETLHRFTSSTSVEHPYQDIIVSRDEIKGRIVGRGGRNVTFFENLFGVDVIFNDEPNTIIIGCFNLVQRETARFALERLMREKNINEEVISRIKPLAEQDMDKLLKKEGEAILKIMGLEHHQFGTQNGTEQVEFAKLIGRLKFRTSYGQNILKHSFEVAYFSRLLASEIGANTRIAWLAGFFHDIGKSVDQETGGQHDVLSKEILEKYNFEPAVVHAAWTHHNAGPQETIEARIVQAADALSASRPGARAESLEKYLEKIKDLQETALSFEGVKKAYAINAGREVRIIVEPEKIKDENLVPLAENIAEKVQEKGGYPGKIKIVTIRATKTTDYAK